MLKRRATSSGRDPRPKERDSQRICAPWQFIATRLENEVRVVFQTDPSVAPRPQCRWPEPWETNFYFNTAAPLVEEHGLDTDAAEVDDHQAIAQIIEMALLYDQIIGTGMLRPATVRGRPTKRGKRSPHETTQGPKLAGFGQEVSIVTFFITLGTQNSATLRQGGDGACPALARWLSAVNLRHGNST